VTNSGAGTLFEHGRENTKYVSFCFQISKHQPVISMGTESGGKAPSRWRQGGLRAEPSALYYQHNPFLGMF